MTNAFARTTKRLLPIPGQDPANEQMMSMIVALTGEITVLRARLDTVERLAEDAGVLTQDAIDRFEPNTAADARRGVLRRDTLQRVFRSLREAGEADLGAMPTRKI